MTYIFDLKLNLKKKERERKKKQIQRKYTKLHQKVITVKQ
jgi:hypothetical protein